MTPVRYPDGTMGIPKEVIQSVNRNKVGLKSPLMTPVGKGFRSLNLALRKVWNCTVTTVWIVSFTFHFCHVFVLKSRHFFIGIQSVRKCQAM